VIMMEGERDVIGPAETVRTGRSFLLCRSRRAPAVVLTRPARRIVWLDLLLTVPIPPFARFPKVLLPCLIPVSFFPLILISSSPPHPAHSPTDRPLFSPQSPKDAQALLMGAERRPSLLLRRRDSMTMMGPAPSEPYPPVQVMPVARAYLRDIPSCALCDSSGSDVHDIHRVAWVRPVQLAVVEHGLLGREDADLAQDRVFHSFERGSSERCRCRCVVGRIRHARGGRVSRGTEYASGMGSDQVGEGEAGEEVLGVM
jgi:hypothetical protein